MAPRPRHPLKSLLMFAVLCGVGYAVWAHRDKLKAGEDNYVPPAEQIETLRQTIEDKYGNDECFLGMRSGILWRKHEGRFRLDIEVDRECDRAAKSLTMEIAQMILRTSGRPVTVMAYDHTGREVARSIL